MAPYSSDPDVRLLLGKIGGRLPAEVDVATFRSIAHADVLDRLGDAYGGTVPTLNAGSDALEAARWAEAKVAAAEILETLRASLPDLGEAPEQLRTSAYATLSRGLPGLLPGGGTTTGPDGSPVATSPRPQVSSFTPVSLFEDPYDALRGDPAYPSL